MVGVDLSPEKYFHQFVLLKQKKTIKRSKMLYNSYYNDHNTFFLPHTYPGFDFLFSLSNCLSR